MAHPIQVRYRKDGKVRTWSGDSVQPWDPSTIVLGRNTRGGVVELLLPRHALVSILRRGMSIHLDDEDDDSDEEEDDEGFPPRRRRPDLTPDLVPWRYA